MYVPQRPFTYTHSNCHAKVTPSKTHTVTHPRASLQYSGQKNCCMSLCRCQVWGVIEENLSRLGFDGPAGLYDAFWRRFYIVWLQYNIPVPGRAYNASYVRIAVSQSADPTRGWHAYAIPRCLFCSSRLLSHPWQLDDGSWHTWPLGRQRCKGLTARPCRLTPNSNEHTSVAVTEQRIWWCEWNICPIHKKRELPPTTATTVLSKGGNKGGGV